MPAGAGVANDALAPRGDKPTTVAVNQRQRENRCDCRRDGAEKAEKTYGQVGGVAWWSAEFVA